MDLEKDYAVRYIAQPKQKFISGLKGLAMKNILILMSMLLSFRAHGANLNVAGPNDESLVHDASSCPNLEGDYKYEGDKEKGGDSFFWLIRLYDGFDNGAKTLSSRTIKNTFYTRYLDGEKHEEEAGGYLAKCFQNSVYVLLYDKQTGLLTESINYRPDNDGNLVRSVYRSLEFKLDELANLNLESVPEHLRYEGPYVLKRQTSPSKD